MRHEFTHPYEDHLIMVAGIYKEVQGKEMLVYTRRWNIADEKLRNAEFLLRIAFLEHGTGSQLQVEQENFFDEEPLHPHKEGWNKALEALNNHLEQL